MRLRLSCLVPLFVATASARAAAQMPVAWGALESPATLNPAARRVIEETAGAYPFIGLKRFAQDSVVLVFEDSALTASGVRANTWMFGPPATKAEADGCPPQKVLGRRIARAFWNAEGKPATVQMINVAVRGTRGTDLDRWVVHNMYYWQPQLTGPWVGDSRPR